MSAYETELLIAGAGYLGLRVAQHFTADDDRVDALTRCRKKANHFCEQAIKPIVGDLGDASTELPLPSARFVLWSVGFDSSAADRESVWLDGLERFVAALPEPPQAFVYVSSTSVYGPGDAGDVNEGSSTAPSTAGGNCCLKAEEWLRTQLPTHCPGTRLIVLRHAGIFGPDRLLRRVEDLRSGVPLAGDPDTWLNLIHVDDAVRLIHHVLHFSDAPDLMNVVNAEAITRRDYYSSLAELVAAPPPVFSTDPASRRSRGGNKRVQTNFRDLCNQAGFQFDQILKDGLPDAVTRSANLTEQA